MSKFKKINKNNKRLNRTAKFKGNLHEHNTVELFSTWGTVIDYVIILLTQLTITIKHYSFVVLA